MAYGLGERDNFAWEAVSVGLIYFGLVFGLMGGVYLLGSGLEAAPLVVALIGVTALASGALSYGPLKRRTTRIAAIRALEHDRDSSSKLPLGPGVPVHQGRLRLLLGVWAAVTAAMLLMAGLFGLVLLQTIQADGLLSSSTAAGLVFMLFFLMPPLLPLGLGLVPVREVAADSIIIGWRSRRTIGYSAISKWSAQGTIIKLWLDDVGTRQLVILITDPRLPDLLVSVAGDRQVGHT